MSPVDLIYDDTTVKGLDQLHNMARSARARLEPTWFLNLAYFEGSQWVYWNGNQLVKPALRANRITIVDNRIQPAVRMEVAKMTKNRPVFTVVPNTAQDDDTNAAKVAEQLMQYAWGHFKLQPLTTKALFWSRITGAAFLKVFWDASLGDKRTVLVGPDGKILTDAQGAPVQAGAIPPVEGIKPKTVAQGDVRVEVRSPFQMFVDPLADTFDEAEWVMEESVKSSDYVKRQYGKRVEPDTPANPGLVEARLGPAFLPGTGNYKGVKVREYWRKPCDEHPDGYRAVWAANQILYVDERPDDPCPYVMLSSIPVPGRLWPTSIVEQLRGPQTELNKVKSQIAENRNRIGNPTILASKQAVQDPENFNRTISQPGASYFFDDIGSPNAVPTYMKPPEMPNYVIEEIQRIEESIQEISGQHDVSSAQVPPGVTAASAINLLQEADDTRLGPGINDYELQIGCLGQKILELMADKYDAARTVRIAGENGAWEIFDFKGAMLKGNTHVRVQAGSAFPQSKAAKQAAMQELLTFFVQSGNPPHGRQLAQFLQDWEVGGADRLIEQFVRDETQVNSENVQLTQGVQVPVHEYDDDQAHIDGHQDFQKQTKYRMLPPQIQQVFQQHVDAHKQRQAQQQQTQLQLQMELAGTIPPNLTAPAQAEIQQLSQTPDPTDMHAAMLHMQGAQQGMDMQGQAQQQNQQAEQAALAQVSQASSTAQQQRHAEERHQQGLRHAEEKHQAGLRQAAQPPQKQQGGRRAA